MKSFGGNKRVISHHFILHDDINILRNHWINGISCVGRYLKGSLKSDSCPCIEPPQEWHQMPENVVWILLELCYASICDQNLREPVVVPLQPLGKEFFPNIQLKLPLTQFHTIFSCPITGHHRYTWTHAERWAFELWV